MAPTTHPSSPSSARAASSDFVGGSENPPSPPTSIAGAGTPPTPPTPARELHVPHRLTIDSAMLERVNRALDEIRSGRMVILVDDEDRENEGDLCLAAQAATPEAINFMAMHGRGLI